MKLITIMYLHECVNRKALKPEIFFSVYFSCITGETFA